MRNEAPQEVRQKAGMRQQVSKDISTEPPIGGWNTRDALDNVPPQDAIQLDNFTCGLGNIAVRKGAVPHSYSTTTDTKTPGVRHDATPVKTLMKYESGSDMQMIAADGGALWIATTAGPISSLDVEERDNDVWDWTNFRGQDVVDRAYLVMVNGVDAYQYSTAAGFEPLTPALSHGGGSIDPIGCFAYKNRMYYWEEGSQSIWYTELYAHGGTITEFPLGDVGSFGGALVAVESWTHDGGSGTDDYILFIMSSGEVLAYQGSYPEDEADWALVGIYNIGRLMGPRCTAKFGADLYLMTDLDIVPMSQVIAGVEAHAQRTKISGAMLQIAALRGEFGFQAELFPPSKLLIFNLPTGTEGEYDQYVMNTVTGAWSRWRDRKAYCWLEYDGKLFYGGDDGVVYEAEVGNVDYKIRGTIFSPGTGGSRDRDDIRATPFTISYICDLNAYGSLPPGIINPYVVDSPFFTEEINIIASVIGTDGENYELEFANLATGDTITIQDAGATETYDVDLTEPAVFLHPGTATLRGTFNPGPAPASLGYAIGEDMELIINGISGPPAGGEMAFDTVPIDAHVQTSWLRFGVEENKQFDAVKVFFRAPRGVEHNFAFGVDYAKILDPEYPSAQPSEGTPWSGEWNPAGGIPDVIPDPTTWWTDEGTNPAVPVNEDTGESGVGAVTKWSPEVLTSEQWELISGYGRALSMIMRISTEQEVQWNLTFWHIKLGTRM